MPAPVRTLLATVLIAALAGAGGFLAYRRLVTPTSDLTPIQPSPSASSVEMPVDRKASNHLIPERVPAVTLTGLDGKRHALADFRAKTLIINFWATWCAPCRREIPLLQTLRQQRRAEGVEVVGIAVDFMDNVKQYVQNIKLDYPLLVGEEDGLAAAESFGMDLVLPFTIFADAQRRIVTVKVGELHADEAAVILDTVREINANTLDLAVAKPKLAAKIRDLANLRATQGAARSGR